jgi:hypothetical protein
MSKKFIRNWNVCVEVLGVYDEDIRAENLGRYF